MTTAIVQAPLAPLYASAQGAELADELFHGSTVEIIASSTQSGLAFVKTAYGYEGHVPEDALVSEPAALSAYRAPAAVVAAPFADAVESPALRARVITTLFMGSYILREGEKDGYAAVRLATGQPAFIRGRQLAPVPAANQPAAARAAALETARAMLGAPYRWGGKTRLGLDCSGLAWLAYHMGGVAIFRDSQIVEGYALKRIPPGKAQAGDLLFFPGHAAICAGDGMVIHSSDKNNGAKQEPQSALPTPLYAGTL